VESVTLCVCLCVCRLKKENGLSYLRAHIICGSLLAFIKPEIKRSKVKVTRLRKPTRMHELKDYSMGASQTRDTKISERFFKTSENNIVPNYSDI